MQAKERNDDPIIKPSQLKDADGMLSRHQDFNHEACCHTFAMRTAPFLVEAASRLATSLMRLLDLTELESFLDSQHGSE